jgi:hypothetical protein
MIYFSRVIQMGQISRVMYWIKFIKQIKSMFYALFELDKNEIGTLFSVEEKLK